MLAGNIEWGDGRNERARFGADGVFRPIRTSISWLAVSAFASTMMTQMEDPEILYTTFIHCLICGLQELSECGLELG